eukprot:gb/GFBE01010120.1/.p1 GENE.gb/GFBE01010120.1/~~gb/GFBE01010120.1/.p1  ORF type:complete len:407 (+),score=85.13 gb/GFBE01010120.1/:1-1221(+)
MMAENGAVLGMLSRMAAQSNFRCMDPGAGSAPEGRSWWLSSTSRAAALETPAAGTKPGTALLEAPTADTLPELQGAQQRQLSGASSSSGVEAVGTEWDIEASIQDASSVQVWHDESFEVVKTLQNAARNKGRVELMKAIDSGEFVAVKRMPITWTGKGHQQFLDEHPAEQEMPWVDVGVVQYLASKDFPYICNPLGVFQSTSETFVVSALATEGDLFGWCQEGILPGAEREDMIRPLARQVFSAVRGLHMLGIAHCDISLENVLLTKGEDGELHMKLIDFGMAAIGPNFLNGARGKPSYQAPEMHCDADYDPYRADSFSLGVVLFCMAAMDYPWMSTRPNCCKAFGFVLSKGFCAYLAKRKARNSSARLSEVFSPPLMELLQELLSTDPDSRAVLKDRSFEWLCEC